MTTRLQRWSALPAALLLAAAAGCGGGPLPEIGAVVPDAPATSDPLVLGATHVGWSQPMCFGCHRVTAPYPHGSAYGGPQECAACHGYNGAPHADHAVAENTACAECHAAVTHTPRFEAPADCLRCHQHPAQP